MEPLEIFKVETTIESESDSYKDILSTIISDLGIARTIGRLYVKIKPEIMLFQMALILRDKLPEIKTIDFSNVEIMDDKGIIINISDEKHIPDLLIKLWMEYGKEKVDQIERKKIIVHIPQENQRGLLDEIKKIENLIVSDPNKTLKKKIIEMAIRAAPEGFRVRHHSFKGESFSFVATERIMNNEWIKEAQSMLYDLKEVN